MAEPVISTRELLYSGHPVLGKLFTLRPWQIFLGASAAATLLLLLPARLLHLDSIPTARGNLGFFYSHWSVMYVLVIPLLLAMATAISERMKNCAVQLAENGRITPRVQADAPDYPACLANFLKSRARLLILVVIAVTIPVNLYDTHDLWPSFVEKEVRPSRIPDWDTGFNARNWKAEYSNADFLVYLNRVPSKPRNFAFDLMAYLFQAGIYFLGLFWIGKFTLYLIAFARLMDGDDSSFQFNPLTNDLDSRMGLRPMGRLFDNFLAITLVLVGYAFYHRLYLIDSRRTSTFGTYIRTTFWNIIQPPNENLVPAPFNHFTELFHLRSWGLDGLDASGWITIVFMAIPIVVVCFLPMWKIRELVDKRRSEELKRLQPEFEAANNADDWNRVQLIEHQKQYLEKANIWPNGNARAKRYLTIIFALAAGSIAPPLLAIVLAVSLSQTLGSYFRLIFPKNTQ